MKKIISLSWLLLALLIFPATLAATSTRPVTILTDPILGVQGKVSVWSYSKAFAKRFNLPEMAEEGLPPDIWAMEFRLVWRNLDGDASFYDCELHVYINNKLKIFYPEGEVGSIETLRMGKPAQPAKMPSTEDRVFHGNESGKYRTKAIFSSIFSSDSTSKLSSSSKASSLGGGVTYLHYRKYFLSDLAYLAYSIGCGSIGNPDEYKLSLWIEKEGGPDYSRGTKEDAKTYANNFHQFSIPKTFAQRFYPKAKLAAEKNSARIDAENRARREKLQQKDNQPKR